MYIIFSFLPSGLLCKSATYNYQTARSIHYDNTSYSNQKNHLRHAKAV